MNGTPPVFSYVEIDVLPRDAGWNLTRRVSVRLECTLPDGTHSNYLRYEGSGHPMAVLSAKRASINPTRCGPRA